MQRWFFANEREVCRVYHERTPSPPTSPRSLTPRRKGQFYRPWYFCVEQPTDHQMLGNEFMAVVGDCDNLGNWDFLRAAVMHRRGKLPKDYHIWRTDEVWIPRYKPTLYRYCIIAVNGDQRIIRFWEVSILPRTLPAQVIGALDDRPHGVETFGKWPDANSDAKIDRGWLTTETIVQFQFIYAPFVWPKDIPKRPLKIRVTPMFMREKAECGNIHRWGPATKDDGDHISQCFNLRSAEQSAAFAFCASVRFQPCEANFHPQEEYGCLCSPDDIVLIHLKVGDFEHTVYRIDLYTPSSKPADDEPSYHYGYQYVEPNQLWAQKSNDAVMEEDELEGNANDEFNEDKNIESMTSSTTSRCFSNKSKVEPPSEDEGKLGQGKLNLKIMCATKHRPLGMMQVGYMVVRGCNPPLKLNMSTTYLRHWNPKYTGISIGHRGCGPTFNSPEGVVREDTLYSAERAAAHGADMVYVNVHLTKDLQPVLHTLFRIMVATIKTAAEEKQLKQKDFENLPLWIFTLQELRDLHRVDSQPEGYYYRLKGSVGAAGLKDDRCFPEGEFRKNQPFTLLADLLEQLDPYVGCILQIRWPQLMANGEMEEDFQPTINKNKYLDAILHTIFRNAGKRRIILISLDVDTCTMLRVKQNYYPVMFEVLGYYNPDGTKFYDKRTRDFAAAVFNAQAHLWLGIITQSRDLLLKTELKHLCRSGAFVLFAWGSELRTIDQVNEVKMLGLEGVIFNRIDKINPKSSKKSVYTPMSLGGLSCNIPQINE